MYYQIAEMKKLANLLHLEAVANPAFSVFVAYGYLRNGGCVWQGSHILRYHIYILRLSYDLKVAVAFAYTTSSTVFKKPVISSEKKERNWI